MGFYSNYFKYEGAKSLTEALQNCWKYPYLNIYFILNDMENIVAKRTMKNVCEYLGAKDEANLIEIIDSERWIISCAAMRSKIEFYPEDDSEHASKIGHAFYCTDYEKTKGKLVLVDYNDYIRRHFNVNVCTFFTLFV